MFFMVKAADTENTAQELTSLGALRQLAISDNLP